MANREALAAAVEVLVVVGVLAGVRTSAASAEVVLHVTNNAQVPAGQFAEARRAVVTVYANIGVHVIWAGGVAATAPADGALHPRRDSLECRDDEAASTQYSRVRTGQPRDEAGCASLCERTLEHAHSTGSDPGRMLGLILAHEIGHMLLPRHSHTAAGLMKAEWIGTITAIPEFLPEQAETIRTLLSKRP